MAQIPALTKKIDFFNLLVNLGGEIYWTSEKNRVDIR